MSSKETVNLIPPNFGKIFDKKCIGVITKTDLLDDNKMLKSIEEHLKYSGAEEVYQVSKYDDSSLKNLKKVIIKYVGYTEV